MYTVKSYRTCRSSNHFRRAVHRFTARFAGGAVAVLLVGGIVAHSAQAQAPALGDHYIFFVDGTNVTLPAVDGVVANDPEDAANKVMQFNNGNWSFQAFRFPDARDLTANRDAGDVIHFRIHVDANNASNCESATNLAIMFEDFDDDASNYPFRLRWTVPSSMCNGAWHDVTLKLPPPTWQELEDGKANGSISGLEANWVYGGTWSSRINGGQGVATDLQGPNSSENGNLWSEFEWNNVRAIGPFWDWGSAGSDGGLVYLDNVYIGPSSLNLGDAAGQPAAMSGVTVRADGAVNVVSWTHNPDFGGYNVYASAAPITDVTDPDVLFLEKVSPDAEVFEVRHQAELPYSSGGSTLYYAVTSLGTLGAENPDVSNSAVEINNPDLAVSPPVLSLTDAEAEALFDAVNSGTVSNENFPAGSMPFVVDDTHSQLSELLTLPDNNADLSGSVWVAYYGGNDAMNLSPEIWIYAEVTDDMLKFAPSSESPAGAWQYDSIEFGWGNYDVRDAGGSVLGGSPHNDMERGEYPDYQLRLSAHGSRDQCERENVCVSWRGQDRSRRCCVRFHDRRLQDTGAFPLPRHEGVRRYDHPLPWPQRGPLLSPDDYAERPGRDRTRSPDHMEPESHSGQQLVEYAEPVANRGDGRPDGADRG